MVKFEVPGTPFRRADIDIPTTKKDNFIKRHPLLSFIGAAAAAFSIYCGHNIIFPKTISSVQAYETTESRNMRLRASMLSNINSKLSSSFICYDPYTGFRTRSLGGVDLSVFSGTNPYHPHLTSAGVSSIHIGQDTFNLSLLSASFDQSGVTLHLSILADRHEFLVRNETVRTRPIPFCSRSFALPIPIDAPNTAQTNPRPVSGLNQPIQIPTIPTIANCNAIRTQAASTVTASCSRFGTPCHYLDYEGVNQQYGNCRRSVESFNLSAEQRRVNLANGISMRHAVSFATALNCFDLRFGFHPVVSINTNPARSNVLAYIQSYLAQVHVKINSTDYYFADSTSFRNFDRRISYSFEPEGLMVNYIAIVRNTLYSGAGYRVTVPYCKMGEN